MKIPIPLNDLDKAILAFQRSQAVVPEWLRLLCAGNLYLLIPFHPEVANRHNPAGVENIFGKRPRVVAPRQPWAELLYPVGVKPGRDGQP